MNKQYITRECTFDSGHRVMNERMKCFNLHGHTYRCQLEFEFNSMESIGYAIDFKEIKRVGLQWIDDMLDHGVIVNPHDTAVIECAKETSSKIWFMSLNGQGNYCNPSVENIAKEIFLAMSILFKRYGDLKLNKITLWETPNCFTTCIKESISEDEKKYWESANYDMVSNYEQEKGYLEYDDRKVKVQK